MQIGQRRNLEEASFRKVLTSERKKFDKKILDARSMLQRRYLTYDVPTAVKNLSVGFVGA
jgi:hypothetical protein